MVRVADCDEGLLDDGDRLGEARFEIAELPFPRELRADGFAPGAHCVDGLLGPLDVHDPGGVDGRAVRPLFLDGNQGIAFRVGGSAARSKAFQRVHDEGAAFVLHPDSLNGGFRDLFGSRRYGEDRLADVSDVVGCERRIGRGRHRRQVGGREDADHSVHAQRFGGVDADHSARGQGTGQQPGEDHAFAAIVFSVLDLAGDLARNVRRNEIESYMRSHASCPEARRTPFM